SRKIFPGDQLLNVDSVALAGLTPDQVVRVLRSILAAKSRVTITVVHPWADRMCSQPSTSRRYLTMPQVVKTSVVVHQPKNENVVEKEIEQPCGEESRPHTINTGAAAIVPVAGRAPSSRSSLRKQDAEGHRMRSSRSKVAPLSIKYPSKEAISSDGSMIPSPDLTTDQSAIKLSPSTLLTTSSNRRPSKSARSVSADSSPTTSLTALALDGTSSNNHVDGGSSSIRSSTPDVIESSDGRRSSFTVMTRDVASAKSDSLNVPAPTNFRLGQFINAVGQRKSLTKNFSNDELPLVSFDQLTQSSSSSSGGKRRDRNDSSQSKSSKGSTRSNKSQELSWHCPVCLDGASRSKPYVIT
uniref:PDZ domain-containing protein n=1 Tax=Romanomermis culicivorax TaxID=13658 RepID=A0A915JC68_ROMCU